MQEPIDNAPNEMLTREEELSIVDRADLIKHILRLESDLAFYVHNDYDYNEELPW
jgi:hypothetical protein